MTRRPKKRGPGRPALGDAGRSAVIRIRMTAAELELLRQQAERDEVTVSEYARRRLLG